MPSLTLSDKYAIGAAIALLIMVLVDNAILMLVLAVIGLVGGVWVVRQPETRRVVWVAAAAFVLALVFAVYALLR
jgi:hypothetical protein